MTETLIAAFVTFVVVIDPVGLTPLFATLVAGHAAAERRRIALRGVLIAAAVLIGFAIGGRSVLTYLGIGLPAFRIAGGILLLLLAVDMVMARQTGLRATTPPEEAESDARDDVSVFPLAIPLIAGPGAMTSVVLLTASPQGGLAGQAAILAVLAVVLAATLAAFLAAERLLAVLGVTGVNVIGRVMGILLAGLSVQFVIDGIRAVFGAAGAA